MKKADVPFHVKGGTVIFLIAIGVFFLFGILLFATSPIEDAIIVILGTLILTVLYWALYKSGRLR